MTRARPFEIVGFTHTTARRADSLVVRGRRAFLLLFVAEGCVDVIGAETPQTLRSGETLLASPVEALPLRLAYDPGADFYLLQFRRVEPRLGAPFRMLEIPERAALKNPGRLKDLLRLFAAAANRQPGSSLFLHHLVALMLCEIASSAAKCETMAHADGLESVASRVDAYIAAHYHGQIGTPDIAREFRYNPDYLERVYRAERHISIREAIHARRIKEACAQLATDTPSRIAEIAALCGYSDAGYFRRVFKRETNMTPHGFRALNARERALRALQAS